MFGQSIIWHVLSNQEPFISFSTTTNQIHHSLVPHFPNSSCLCLTKSKPLTKKLAFPKPLTKYNVKKMHEGKSLKKSERILNFISSVKPQNAQENPQKLTIFSLKQLNTCHSPLITFIILIVPYFLPSYFILFFLLQPNFAFLRRI